MTGQIFWGPESREFHPLRDAQGPEWVALAILSFVLVVFGMLPAVAVGPVDTAVVPLLLRLIR